MKEIFINSDAKFYPLVDYAKTFLCQDAEDYNIFQLPPIQRNAVWNTAQIERCWDSILRGFPIGSFLVASRREGDVARDIYTGIQKESITRGYFLLDGQQRTRCILFGFKPIKNARLWIDLSPNLTFDNADQNDRKFLFRVISSYQPWGMNDASPGEKLNEHLKYQARLELGLKSIRYDYDVPIYNLETIREEKYSWPVKAVLPIPFDELVQLCGGTSGKFKEPRWEHIIKLIPSRYHTKNLVPSEPTRHLYEILNGLKNILEVHNSNIKTRKLVVMLHHQENNHTPDNCKDPMEVLFVRINSMGSELTGEEMAYSLLKSSWDGAYEMVSSIVNDKSIGYLLKPTSIVMAATRLARFIQKENDLPNPSVGAFRKWIGNKPEEIPFLTAMQGLLNPDDSGQSCFRRILKAFCQLVLYRKNTPDDIGLPKKLLLSIKSVLYHPIFIWIHYNELRNDILENNRINILRYLLYCFITVDKNDMASKIAIEAIKQNGLNSFPDKDIYNTLLKKGLTTMIPTPEQFMNPFAVEGDGFLRSFDELFNLQGDPYNTFRQWFWLDSKELLLWFQRAHSAKWFAGYNPTSDDAYDTPFDWDHIVPYSHVIGQGNYNIPCENSEQFDRFWKSRYVYINSIGNLRIWPSWCNRSDSNKCHTLKLRLEEFDLGQDSTALELELCSTQDFLHASAIDDAHKPLWCSAGGSPRNWGEKRRVAWQKAVEFRVLYLYSTFYKTFNFSLWK